ncbi:unnamed protein product [Candida verbasci]|uniref:tRNA-binding domain-containing protein n=1 Tax=Candida verbasci TaxID=1227364 RepID=A0A9W4TSI2_9ASCO|nr:unnamed protein product [Candida verbasci]
MYISDIDVKDKILQVCSGLKNFIPLDQMINRRVVVVTNMKTKKLRGEKSMGMILAAEKETVKLINPPNCEIGERLYFDYTEVEPTKLKIEIWKMIQPKLRTREGKVYFEDIPLQSKDGQFATVDLDNAEVK